MTQPYYAVANHFFVRDDSPYQDRAGARRASRSGRARAAATRRTSSASSRSPASRSSFDVDGPRSSPTRPSPRASRTSRTGRSTRSCAPSRSARRSEDGPAAAAPSTPSAFTYYPSGFVDKSSGYRPGPPSSTRSTRSSGGRQADGTLKAMSMQWFGADYATAGGEFDLDSRRSSCRRPGRRAMYGVRTPGPWRPAACGPASSGTSCCSPRSRSRSSGSSSTRGRRTTSRSSVFDAPDGGRRGQGRLARPLDRRATPQRRLRRGDPGRRRPGPDFLDPRLDARGPRSRPRRFLTKTLRRRRPADRPTPRSS